MSIVPCSCTAAETPHNDGMSPTPRIALHAVTDAGASAVRPRGRRMFAGVAAGIADWAHLPVLLLRLLFLIAAFLGLGAGIYLWLAVALPSAPKDDPEATTTSAPSWWRIPLGRYRVSPLDVVLLVMAGILTITGLMWLSLAVHTLPIQVLATAHLGFLLAMTALPSLLAALRRYRAAQRHEAGSDPEEILPLVPGARRPRTSSPRIPVTMASGLNAALIMIGVLCAASIATNPQLLPPRAYEIPLPWTITLGFATAGIAISAGIFLVVLGLKGRASVGVSAVGILALILASAAGAWSTTMVDRAEFPMAYRVEAYVAGGSVGCVHPTPLFWGRPVVLDLSAMTPDTIAAGVQAAHPGQRDLTMTVTCHTEFTHLTVILPPDARDIEGVVHLRGSTAHGEAPRRSVSAVSSDPRILIEGAAWYGTVTYTTSQEDVR